MTLAHHVALPYPYPATITHAAYKTRPQDFIVNELMDIAFRGDGEHLWLKIEKTQLNTAYVAKLLANWAHIPVKDVGFSGLKDRHAVTTQWFSLRIPNKVAPATEFSDGSATALQANESLTLLESHWHHKKLNRGTHTANQFILTLRDVAGDISAIEQQLEQIKTQGVPNYFGEQRFGRDTQNIAAAIELFESGKINGKKVHRKFDQDKISLYLSAARGVLFNAILAVRVSQNSWHTPQLGDVMNLAGSNSIFVLDGQANLLDEQVQQRVATGDIHLTGALWGDGELKSQFGIAELEQAVIHGNASYQQLAKGLVTYGLKHQRRPLRLLPQHMGWRWLDATTLQLEFTLPVGSFATTILAALISDLN